MLISLDKFQGEYPRVGKQLLAVNAAVFAENVRLLSGNLTLWNGLDFEDALCKVGTVNAVYLMDSQYWLHWVDSELGAGQVNVDVARGPIAQDVTERTIFTGTDVPRVTNIALATGSTGCYPQDSYKLGVPAPEDAPDLTVTNAVSSPTAVTLTNAGAEAGTTTGWTGTGDFSNYDNTDVVGLTAQTGNFFFGGGTAGTTTATQNLDATSSGVFVGQVLVLKWWQAAGANMSKAYMSIVYKDISNVEITRIDGMDISYATPNVWTQRTIQLVVPSGTDNIDIVQTYTKVGGGDNDAYIDTITLDKQDASVSYDGSTLTDFTVATASGGSVVVSGATGFPAPGFRFTARGGRYATIYKNFNVVNSPVYTVDFDFERDPSSGGDNDHFVLHLSNSASGSGDSISFRQGDMFKSTSSGWTTFPVNVTTLDTYPSNQLVEVHVAITVTKTGTGTASVDYILTRDNGATTLATGTTTIAVSGDYIGWEYTGDGSGDDHVTLDNINLSISSPTSSTTGQAAVFTNYVFTYVNTLGQEGPPSPVSRTIQHQDDGSVTITTPTTFADPEYAIVSKRIYRAATSNGVTAYLFVAEIPLAQEDYIDTFLDSQLGEELQTVDWDLPPEDGFGVIALPNGVTAMASKNQFCPSVINQFHAYPVAYRLNFDSNIVAIAAIDTSVVVGTQTYPYLVVGSDPSQMSSAKFEQRQACVSKRSMVSMRGYGVVYASPDGLVSINGAGGLELVTDPYMSRREWQALFPETIIAVVHDDRYYGWYNNGVQRGFIFDPRQGGNGLTFLDMDEMTAAYSDPMTDHLYLYVVNGLYRWDADEAAPLTMLWKSKEFQLPRAANFRAMQLRGTYDGSTPITVKVYSNGALLFTKVVTTENEFVLPPNHTTKLQISVEGVPSEIRLIQIAEEIEELE